MPARAFGFHPQARICEDVRKKLRSLGSDLGSAFRGFKKAMNDGESEEQSKQIQGPASKDAEFPEVAAKAPQPSASGSDKPAPHA